MDIAVFGAGCFWCIEAIFSQLNGVIDLSVGYTGGNVKNPTYQEVCSGKTGHAEVLKITYNPSKISYEDLLKVFWETHDPTTLNRQGNDIGTQYRSSIFTDNKKEIKIIKTFVFDLENKKIFKNNIVTTIENKLNFYEAEKYHHDYYNLNKNAPYCSAVISPKLKKFINNGRNFLKEN